MSSNSNITQFPGDEQSLGITKKIVKKNSLKSFLTGRPIFDALKSPVFYLSILVLIGFAYGVSIFQASSNFLEKETSLKSFQIIGFSFVGALAGILLASMSVIKPLRAGKTRKKISKLGFDAMVNLPLLASMFYQMLDRTNVWSTKGIVYCSIAIAITFTGQRIISFLVGMLQKLSKKQKYGKRLPPETRKEILSSLRLKKHSLNSIARMFNVSAATVKRLGTQAGLDLSYIAELKLTKKMTVEDQENEDMSQEPEDGEITVEDQENEDMSQEPEDGEITDEDFGQAA
jgi:hypothetical protein